MALVLMTLHLDAHADYIRRLISRAASTRLTPNGSCDTGETPPTTASLSGPEDVNDTGYVDPVENAAFDSETALSAHLRVSGCYWAMCALELTGKATDADRKLAVSIVNEASVSADFTELATLMSMKTEKSERSSKPLDSTNCAKRTLAWGGAHGHDPHLLHTLSAIQVIAMGNALDSIDTDAVATYVALLQNSDGSFCGDGWGEVDTRFSYCAVATLAIIGKLHTIDTQKAVEYLVNCMNFDGGFGSVPHAESHAGQSMFGFIAAT